jgi:hypothetical protein
LTEGTPWQIDLISNSDTTPQHQALSQLFVWFRDARPQFRCLGVDICFVFDIS